MRQVNERILPLPDQDIPCRERAASPARPPRVCTAPGSECGALGSVQHKHLVTQPEQFCHSARTNIFVLKVNIHSHIPLERR